MRKEIYRMDRAEAEALLARAPVVHIASTADDGSPVLRTVHGVVVSGALAFHGAPAGEKTEIIGRAAVASAEETVALIPSYFIDPERACPATTYYRSAQVHGVLERVDDPVEKARVLDALMAKLQPQGGHAPIDPANPRYDDLYRKPVGGILIVRMSLDRLDGKAKLGQNRSPAELGRVLEQLWARGLPGDPRAIEIVRDANPGCVVPPFLAGPPGLPGVRLVCALSEDDAAPAADLLRDAYWNEGVSRDELLRAQLGSSAWVGARDDQGSLVATARAVGDGVKNTRISDVMIAPAYRGRGLGGALVRVLLDHPAVRGARAVSLGTRDADPFYERFGFREKDAALSRSARHIEMTLVRR